jgi:hypothetical protein
MVEVGSRHTLVFEVLAEMHEITRKQHAATPCKVLHEKYGDRLEIVHIAVPQNQTPERVRSYVERRGLPGRFVFDADGAAYKAFAAYHTSYIIVLDRNGTVVHSSDGPKQELEAAVVKALRF